MGTKNNPGDFDCYENAEPDEPMFILLGRDPIGPTLVDHWADAREALGDDPAKVAEARECAEAMRKYLASIGRREPGHIGTMRFDPDETLERLKGRPNSRSQTHE